AVFLGLVALAAFGLAAAFGDLGALAFLATGAFLAAGFFSPAAFFGLAALAGLAALGFFSAFGFLATFFAAGLASLFSLKEPAAPLPFACTRVPLVTAALRNLRMKGVSRSR